MVQGVSSVLTEAAASSMALGNEVHKESRRLQYWQCLRSGLRSGFTLSLGYHAQGMPSAKPCCASGSLSELGDPQPMWLVKMKL